jgi:hypothetical protein
MVVCSQPLWLRSNSTFCDDGRSMDIFNFSVENVGEIFYEVIWYHTMPYHDLSLEVKKHRFEADS